MQPSEQAVNKSKTLVEAYEEFRKKLDHNSSHIPYLPFNWVKMQDSYALLDEFGLEKYRLHEISREHANDLSNIINELINNERKLRTWTEIIQRRPELDEKFHVFFEFIKPLAEQSLNLPYTIQARFYFSIASIRHQANLILKHADGYQDFSALPADKNIDQEIAAKMLLGWSGKKKLLAAIGKINSGQYQKATKNFRSVYSHRHWPGLEIGVTKTLFRVPNENSVGYRMFGGTPLSLSETLSQIQKQCDECNSAYTRFRHFVESTNKSISA